MILPIPSGRITAPFSEPRPLGSTPTHVHGAIDVAPTSVHGVVAPVSGRAQFLQFIRPNITSRFPADDKDIILRHPTHNYFYDLYGGICTIIDKHTGNIGDKNQIIRFQSHSKLTCGQIGIYIVNSTMLIPGDG